MRNGRAHGLRDFSERVQRRLHLGALVSGVDYVQAVRRRRELRAELQAAMRDLDVVITAGAPGEAPQMDAIPKWDLFDKPNFTMPFNVTGYPAYAFARASAWRIAGQRADRRQAVSGCHGAAGR